MFGTYAGQVQLEAVTNEFNHRGICTLLVWEEVVFVALWIFLGTRSGLLVFEIKEEAAHAVQGVVLMEILNDAKKGGDRGGGTLVLNDKALPTMNQTN